MLKNEATTHVSKQSGCTVAQRGTHVSPLIGCISVVVCFLLRSEREGSLTEGNVSPATSHIFGDVCVCVSMCSVTAGHGLLIHKASAISSMFALLLTHEHITSHSPTFLLLPLSILSCFLFFPFLHTRTSVRLTAYTSCTYIRAIHPSPVAHTRADCLVANPAALTRLAALLSLCSDR